jgi:hypothetical protein
MAKKTNMTNMVNFNEISKIAKEFETNSSIKTIEIQGIQVEIKQYLDMSTKRALVNVIKDNCLKDGKYDFMLQEMAYELLMVKYYSNISISDKSDCYDILKKTSFVDAIIDAIPEKEKDIILEGLESCIEEEIRFNESEKQIGAVLKRIVDMVSEFKNNLPEGTMEKIIEGLGTINDMKNVEKYQGLSKKDNKEDNVEEVDGEIVEKIDNIENAE